MQTPIVDPKFLQHATFESNINHAGTVLAKMMPGTIRRSLLDTRSFLPPSFLLPCRARLINTVSHSTEAGQVPEPLLNPGVDISPKPLASQSTSKVPQASPAAAQLRQPTSLAPRKPTTPISDTVKELLPVLRAERPHYMTALLHARPYLVTEGDIIRLPFFMHGVSPGDILRLNRASTIGSRNYTLKAGAVDHHLWNGKTKTKQSYLDERLFVCRAVVLGTESEPMRFKEKTKRRQRRVKTVRSKHRYTILKVKEVTINRADEIEGGEED